MTVGPNPDSIDTSSDVERAVTGYIKGRGGHDSQCCIHRLGYGCNCRVGDWADAFRAGLLAALSPSPVEAWQPIETAPKDGTLLLLVDQSWGVVVIGGWFQAQWQFADVSPLGRLCVEQNAWRKGYGPTHWRPLPEPPAIRTLKTGFGGAEEEEER